MTPEPLRIVAFCVFLGSWLVLVVVALLGLPRFARQSASSFRFTASELVGMLLQGASALPITLSLPAASLRPTMADQVGTILLAPMGVGILCWTLSSLPRGSATRTLVTDGAYAWVRHPMYAAFLAMLLATGLVVSARMALLASVMLYVVGTELRVASEEAELQNEFTKDYEAYRRRTRWRYLPGLR